MTLHKIGYMLFGTFNSKSVNNPESMLSSMQEFFQSSRLARIFP
jgi:hypothetical protein